MLNVGDGYGLRYCLERCRRESDEVEGVNGVKVRKKDIKQKRCDSRDQ